MRAHRESRSLPGQPAGSNDWSDIHFAYQVARLGTLSAAAQALEVHHSTVLRRIDSLEARLKTRLFHRHARGYTPTEAGKLLLQVASQTQDEFDRMIGQLAGADDQLTGTLAVTTVNTLAGQLTPVLARFQQRHPEIHIDYIADSRILKLEYAEAHVSIRPGAKPKDPDYVVQHLRTMATTFYASSAYIKRFGTMEQPGDIKGHRFITSIAPMANIKYLAWMKKHIPQEQIYYRASDFNAMAHAAESGMGVAPVNCWQAETSKRLLPLFPAPSEWDSDLWLVTHRDIHRTPKVQALCQHLKEELTIGS